MGTLHSREDIVCLTLTRCEGKTYVLHDTVDIIPKTSHYFVRFINLKLVTDVSLEYDEDEEEHVMHVCFSGTDEYLRLIIKHDRGDKPIEDLLKKLLGVNRYIWDRK